MSRKKNRRFWLNTSISALFVMHVIFCVSPVAAETPTQQQIDIFKNLPAAQQTEILRSLNKKPIIKKTGPMKYPVVVKPVSTISSSQNLVTKLKKTSLDDKEELKPFGYDLFSGTPTTFSPVTEIPVPINYVIGPGDTVQIQFFGKENSEYELVVDRNGQLQLPGIGPIAVTGMRFNELKSNLTKRISKQMIGVKAYISLGALRSMRVFIMGDVNRPGSYMVSALSTMTNALFVSGGVKTIGSLRDIQLKRRGKIVQHMDLYDLLLNGDTSSDTRIQPGDVIFVPPIGKTVGIAGEVRRPAIYEIKDEYNVKQMLRMSGGMLPTAYSTVSQLERISAQGEKILIDIDLSSDAGKSHSLSNGDIIRIYSILDKMENIVLVSGHVQRPGGYQWHEGMKLSDVIPSIKYLRQEPNLQVVLIRRETYPDREIEILLSRLDKIFANVNSSSNISLHPRDKVYVFGLSNDAIEDKNKTLTILVEELKQQVKFDQPESVVNIEGNIRWPGEYPISSNMRLQELIRMAGDMERNTDAKYVLVIKEDVHGNQVTAKSYDLLNTDQLAVDINPLLMPRDKVYVFNKQADRPKIMESSLEDIRSQAGIGMPAAIVRVSGFVRSPGEYPLEAGMTILDILRASGGLTEAAYTLEAEISRFEVVDKKNRITRHIPVKLSDLLTGSISANLILKPHDNLHIKPLPNWSAQKIVEISGEVRFPGKYPVRRGETLNELLSRAGGLTDLAFPVGAVLVRESLRRKEQEQLDIMSSRLESDLAAIDLEKATITDEEQRSAGMAGALLKQLESTKAVGRLVINLPELLADESESATKQDILLRDGDKLFIPPITQEVTILGEIQYSTSHLFQEDLSVQDFIDKSGGLTYRADEDRVYVVRANGAVLPSHSAEWFSDNLEVKPGDTIVVPLDAERMRSLTLWTNVSQIVYQLGIAAASWNAVGIF